MTAARLSLFFAYVVVAAAALAAPSSQVFEIPDHGALTLLVPDGWEDKLRQPPNRLPPTILLRPMLESGGEVILTALWPIGPAAKIPDEATLRSDVAAAATSAMSQSVETVLPLKEIKGANGRGFYFAATDRAPNPGEYKYLTQGIVRVGEIALAFTVLTNDGQETVIRQALDMLRTAVHRPSSRL